MASCSGCRVDVAHTANEDDDAHAQALSTTSYAVVVATNAMTTTMRCVCNNKRARCRASVKRYGVGGDSDYNAAAAAAQPTTARRLLHQTAPTHGDSSQRRPLRWYEGHNVRRGRTNDAVARAPYMAATEERAPCRLGRCALGAFVDAPSISVVMPMTKGTSANASMKTAQKAAMATSNTCARGRRTGHTREGESMQSNDHAASGVLRVAGGCACRIIDSSASTSESPRRPKLQHFAPPRKPEVTTSRDTGGKIEKRRRVRGGASCEQHKHTRTQQTQQQQQQQPRHVRRSWQ